MKKIINGVELFSTDGEIWFINKPEDVLRVGISCGTTLDKWKKILEEAI